MIRKYIHCKCFILNALFSFVDIQQENGVRPYMSTCRKRAMHWWCLLMGNIEDILMREPSRYKSLFSTITVPWFCDIYMFYQLHMVQCCFFFFFCLSRNDFSIGCFLLCLVRSYPCIVQCVRCSLISMLNMHVDLLMGLWGTFSAKSIH